MNLFENLQNLSDVHALQEMATIGKPINGYSVSIYDSEGTIPHLHFINSAGRTKAKGKDVVNVPIKLMSPEYFHHGKYKGILTNNQIEILIAILSSKPSNPNSQYKSNYQEVIARWNEANNYWNTDNPNYVDINTPMPDYKQLI